MDRGAGKEEASASVMQPQGAGGVTGGARWGRPETVGRSRRLVMVMGRRRGKEEKEGRRRREERWSRMEGCGGDAASGALLAFQLGAFLSPYLLS